MKRVYYIANAYDGSYFVLTDNIEEYFRRLASYAMNLEQSQKLNHYNFGSVEMSQKDYELQQTEAQSLESSLIQQKSDENQPEKQVEKSKEELSIVNSEKKNNDENPDNVIPLFQ